MPLLAPLYDNFIKNLNNNNMKRNMFLIAIAMTACVMVSCASKDANKEVKAETENVAADQDQTKKDIVEMLTKAYDDANVLATPSEDGMEANIDLFGQYCSASFNELLCKVRVACGNLENQEDCFFTDENMLWLGKGGKVKIENIDVDMKDPVTASYDVVNEDGTKMTTEVSLVNENGAWKINDWLQRGMDGVSLVENMTEFVEKHTKK